MIDINGYWLRWFDYWLKGVDNGIMSEPTGAHIRDGRKPLDG